MKGGIYTLTIRPCAYAISRRLVALGRNRSMLPGVSIPFSKLSCRGRIGKDFFHRLGIVSNIDHPAIQGMMSDFAAFRRTDFAPEKIHPAISSFYEQTTSYCLRMRSHWHFGFRLVANIYKRFSSRLGQLNFPSPAEQEEDLTDHFLMINDADAQQRRMHVRGCARTYSRSGTTMYVAVFSTHTDAAQTYMNIAFPLPGGNMTFIRRIEAVDMPTGPQGILLTTLPPSVPFVQGDEGVYFVNPLLPIRLPIHETLRIWPVNPPDLSNSVAREHECGQAENTLMARHDMWFFGIKCLTVDYSIFPKASPAKPLLAHEQR